MSVRFSNIIMVLLFAGSMLFLSFNRHSRSGIYNYHSEIWGDKAGYYVYLPATLKYAFDATAFPDSVDLKTGQGFQIDSQRGRIVTKYTMGIAWMLLPFYLAADLLASISGQPADGFSMFYQKSINIAAVFYLVLGLVFLYGFLRVTFRRKTSLIVLFAIVFGTNLFYYSVDETGMSHVYSFALFSIFLWMIQRWIFGENLSNTKWFLVAVVATMIVLVRPTNLLFVLFAFSLFVFNLKDIHQKIFPLLQLRKLAIAALPIVVLFGLQLLYWNYAYGGFTLYSYNDEGFKWLAPSPHITLLAPNNGLFLYTPFFILVLISFIMLLRSHAGFQAGIKSGLLFLLITYIFSCWWVPDFGCSFGARNYVEYYAAFAFPLAYLFKKVQTSQKITQGFFWGILILLIAFNLKLTYTWDECFYGVGYWDWQEYFRLVLAAPK